MDKLRGQKITLGGFHGLARKICAENMALSNNHKKALGEVAGLIFILVF